MGFASLQVINEDSMKIKYSLRWALARTDTATWKLLPMCCLER